MGDFTKWLLDEDQKELFEALYAAALNTVFLVLIALVLWPIGKAAMAFNLAKGYLVFWLVTHVITALVGIIQRILRVDIYSHFDAFLISAAVVSAFLQAGWSAFAALTIQSFVVGAPIWTSIVLYVIGLLSSYVAFAIICAYYGGSFYRMVNLPLSVVSYIIFSVWPGIGRVIYGWFFDWF